MPDGYFVEALRLAKALQYIYRNCQILFDVIIVLFIVNMLNFSGVYRFCFHLKVKKGDYAQDGSKDLALSSSLSKCNRISNEQNSRKTFCSLDEVTFTFVCDSIYQKVCNLNLILFPNFLLIQLPEIKSYPIKLLCRLFTYCQSFPNLFNHQIVIGITVSSSETSYF